MVLLNVTECNFILYSSFDNNYIMIQVLYDELYCKNMLYNLKIIYFERLLHEICINTI